MSNKVPEIVILSSSDEETSPKISLNAKENARSMTVSTKYPTKSQTNSRSNVIPLPYYNHPLPGNSQRQVSNPPKIVSQPIQNHLKGTARKSVGTPTLSNVHTVYNTVLKKNTLHHNVHHLSSISINSKSVSKMNSCTGKDLSKSVLPVKSSLKVNQKCTQPIVPVKIPKKINNTVGKSNNGNASQLHSIEHSLRKSGISITLSAQRFSNATKSSKDLPSGSKSKNSCCPKDPTTSFCDITVTSIKPPGHSNKNLNATSSKKFGSNSSEPPNKNGILHLPFKSIPSMENKGKPNPLLKGKDLNVGSLKNMTQNSKISCFQPNLSKSATTEKRARTLDSARVPPPSQDIKAPNSKRARLENPLNQIILASKGSKNTFSEEKKRIQSMRKSIELIDNDRATNTCAAVKETKLTKTSEVSSKSVEKLDTHSKEQSSSLGHVKHITSPPKTEDKIQKKQVTSPKLSLKRKPSVQEDNSTKKTKLDSGSTPIKVLPDKTFEEKVPFHVLDDNKSKLKKLLEFSLPFLKQHPFYDSGEELKVKKTLLKYMNSTKPSYAESKEFSDYLLGSYNKIKDTPNDIFVHLKDIKLTLKAHVETPTPKRPTVDSVPVKTLSVGGPEVGVPDKISSAERNKSGCDKLFITEAVIENSSNVPTKCEPKSSNYFEVLKHPEVLSNETVQKSVERSKEDSLEIESPSLISAENFSHCPANNVEQDKSQSHNVTSPVDIPDTTVNNAEHDVHLLSNVVTPVDVPDTTANNAEHDVHLLSNVVSPVDVPDTTANNVEHDVHLLPNVISSVDIPDTTKSNEEYDETESPSLISPLDIPVSIANVKSDAHDIKNAKASKEPDSNSSSLNLTEMEELRDEKDALKVNETVKLDIKSNTTEAQTIPRHSSATSSDKNQELRDSLPNIIDKIEKLISPKVVETQQFLKSLTSVPKPACEESSPDCDDISILSLVPKISENSKPGIFVNVLEQPASPSASPIKIVSVSSIREGSPEISFLGEVTVHPWDSPKRSKFVATSSKEDSSKLKKSFPSNSSLSGHGKADIASPGSSKANVASLGTSKANVASPGTSKAHAVSPDISKANVASPCRNKAYVPSPTPSKTNVASPGLSNVRMPVSAPTKANASLPGPSDAGIPGPSEDINSLEKSNFKPNSKSIQAEVENRIIDLEKFLAKLDRKIKAFNKRELTLDDLDNNESVYIREEKYKKKFVQVWNKICFLKKCSPRLGRSTQKKLSFSGTRYDEVNHAIERFINKRKPEDRFPNYSEVLNVVQRVEEVHQLAIPSVEALARDVFAEVGRELKRRREKDLYKDIGCYLTDDIDLDEDPANKDPDLETRLQKNHEEGERKINELINKFADDAHNNLEESCNEEVAGDECETSAVNDADGLSETDPNDNSPDEEDPLVKVPSKITKEEDVSSNASTEPKDDEPRGLFKQTDVLNVDELSSTSPEPDPFEEVPHAVSITEDIVVLDDSSDGASEPVPNTKSSAHHHSSHLTKTVLNQSREDIRACTLLDDSCSSSSSDLPSLSELISSAQK